jgi:hypothetical protein
VKQIRKRLTYANVMSSIAVFLVLGGATALAAGQLAKNSVGKKQLKANAVTTAKLKKNAVTTAKIKNNAVTEAKIKNGAITSAKLGAKVVTGANIADDTITAANVAPGSLSSADLTDVRMIPLTKIGATGGADFEAARKAAPSHVLFSKGPLTVYAKCITDDSSPRTYAIAYISTTQAGSVLVSGEDSLEGDPFLNPDTEEEDREVYDDSAGENSASGFRAIFQAAAPDGTSVSGQVATYAKNGSLPGGDGIYGSGNQCLFSGFVNG